jgi:acyl-coenzyme A thioesterase PaaI-like protein
MLRAMTAAARRSAAEQARLDNLLTSLFEQQIRFNQVLGLKLIQMHPPTLRFDMRPELIGHYLYGRLHGGVISATLDAMGGLALMWAIGEKHVDETSQQVLHRFSRLGTIDLRVDYLRAATPGLDLYGRSECYRVTRNVAFIRAVAYEHAPDDPFASCLGTFMLGANRSDSPFERLVPPVKAGKA